MLLGRWFANRAWFSEAIETLIDARADIVEM
jgi:hypothetical protein